MTNPHRSEYLRRIHCAQDHIEQHLAEPLPLEEIARVAHFSPYHFHRIYSSLMGETLYQFILRVRLSRAGCQLRQNPSKSITAIALDCGFSSSATFARAFKAFYGQSASVWRGTQESKNRKTLSKDGKAEGDADGYLPCVGTHRLPARSEIMSVSASQVLVEDLPKMTVAYVRHVGPYAGDPGLFGRLFGRLMTWAGPRGLLGPDARTLSIYHDSPDITEPAKLRTSCCVTVPPDTRGEGEVGIMEIAAGKYARARFEIDMDQYGGAWAWFMGEWMPSSGYQPDDGPPYELYLNDPSQHPEGKCLVEITMPVRPL
jgi:AraC family transcriptional regulator